MTTASILFFFEKIGNFNGVSPVGGPICVTMPSFIKIGQTVSEIWRFNRFHIGGRPPAWILKIQIL